MPPPLLLLIFFDTADLVLVWHIFIFFSDKLLVKEAGNELYTSSPTEKEESRVKAEREREIEAEEAIREEFNRVQADFRTKVLDLYPNPPRRYQEGTREREQDKGL
ncbi:hypothetical protein K1719_037401 [Acacia pycnantha]|nr:hypothetical protein K1719_037401 [Acacia pycnantha]